MSKSEVNPDEKVESREKKGVLINPDNVSVITDLGNGRGYVNDQDTRQIILFEVLDAEKIIYKKVILRCCLSKVTVYQNPYTKTKKYQICFETIDKREVEMQGSMPEIFSKLEHEAVISNRGGLKEAVNSIIAAMLESGKVKIKHGVDVKGFSFDEEGTLVAKGISENRDVSKLQDALKVLNEIPKKWFRSAQGKVVTVILWAIMSSFAFAKKQRRTATYPWLILVGVTCTGKTTLALLAAYIWGLTFSEYENSTASINTEARLGLKLSRSTFPLMVNEIAGIFRRDNAKQRELMKNAWDSPTVRGRYRNGIYDEELSLSPLILTSNSYLRLSNNEIRRFREIEFNWKDIHSEEQRKSFEEWKSNLNKLNVLGPFIYDIVAGDPSILDGDDFEAAGQTVLERLYKMADMKVPVWVKFRAPANDTNLSMSKAELKSDIKDLLHQYVIDRLKAGNSFKVEFNTLSSRLKKLRTLSIPSDVMMFHESEEKDTGTKKDAKKEGEMVVVKRGFLNFLNSRGVQLSSLSELAELFKGTYYAQKTIRPLKIVGLAVAQIPLLEIKKVEEGDEKPDSQSSGSETDPIKDTHTENEAVQTELKITDANVNK